MKVNTKTRYALRMLLDLADAYPNHAVYLKDIALSENISEKYLSQIVISLKQNDLITTFNGVHSGYVLTKDPKDIKLFDIYVIFEGENIMECLENNPVCSNSLNCKSIKYWNLLNNTIQIHLKNTTLADLL